MWQTDWAKEPPSWRRDEPRKVASAVDWREIEAIYALYWCEHCIECAIPQCYSVCPLYTARQDRKCARFQYGIFPNPGFRGLHAYGADIEFRRWGKLESWLRYGPVKPAALRRLAALDQSLLRMVNPLSTLLEPLNPKRKINGGYALLRDKALQTITRIRRNEHYKFDAFVVEVWNPADLSVSIIIEAHQDELKFRTSLNLAPGQNLHQIPFESMNLDLSSRKGRILVYPDNDLQARLIFTWLDFVKFRPKPVDTLRGKRAAKVKCAVWDLDNTLWKGILVEDGPEGVSLRSEALQLVRALDELGVIQSIASKNDYALAWPLVEKFGLQDYFLYPAIHWGPKSSSIRKIAEELNIGVDSVAVIDDSPFERAEIGKELPEVRTYSDSDIETLLARPEFELPVTEESKHRREFYLAEARRKRIAESYSGNYEEFLRGCRMETLAFTPREPQDVERCLELLQRSNQLNLTTHRYQRDEFLSLLADPQVLSVAIRCSDRFGEYGTVGFASIALSGDGPLLRDFVLSCRVAQKKVENAWFKWIIRRLATAGHTRLRAWFVTTERNGVLLSVLEEVGFKEIAQRHGERLFELSLLSSPPAADIVTIRDRDIPQIPGKPCGPGSISRNSAPD